MLDDRLPHLDQLDRRFHRIARELRPFDLQRLENGETRIDADEVFGEISHRGSSHFFMGFYTKSGIQTALEHYGLIETLARRGFHDVRVTLGMEDPFLHKLMIHDGPLDRAEDRLAELHVRRVSGPEEVPAGWPPGLESDFLSIEWLMMQNPRRRFSPERPALPGQHHPGLGIGPEIMEMIQIMAERLRLAGIVTKPDHYHNAVLYSVRYHFVDPAVEGRLQALWRDLKAVSLSEASWAVHLGAVIDPASGRPLEWRGREEVFAIDRRVSRYFESAAYRRERDAWIRRSRFVLDTGRFDLRKAASEEYRATHET